MPPRAPGQLIPASTSISPWYGKLRGRVIQPNPTEKNLSEQVRFRQAKRKRRPVHTPQTKCPTKQAAELLKVPLTIARKSRILRLVHVCDPAVKLQVLDHSRGADPPPSIPPPPPRTCPLTRTLHAGGNHGAQFSAGDNTVDGTASSHHA